VLFAHVAENARSITQAVQLQSVIKYVERVGDHAANLGETVVLMVRGEALRHGIQSGGSVRAVPDDKGN